MPKETTAPNFAQKTFMNSHKTAKFVKVFSLKVPCYMCIWYFESIVEYCIVFLLPIILGCRGKLLEGIILYVYHMLY